jgi:hypothetical protein
MSAQDDLAAIQDVIRLLREHGWAKYRFRGRKGQMCLAYAMDDSVRGAVPGWYGAGEAVLAAARELYPQRVRAESLIGFNDHWRTRKRHVLAVLRLAEEKARARMLEEEERARGRERVLTA